MRREHDSSPKSTSFPDPALVSAPGPNLFILFIIVPNVVQRHPTSLPHFHSPILRHCPSSADPSYIQTQILNISGQSGEVSSWILIGPHRCVPFAQCFFLQCTAIFIGTDRCRTGRALGHFSCERWSKRTWHCML
jgi:hypothetical protein